MLLKTTKILMLSFGTLAMVGGLGLLVGSNIKRNKKDDQYQEICAKYQTTEEFNIARSQRKEDYDLALETGVLTEEEYKAKLEYLASDGFAYETMGKSTTEMAIEYKAEADELKLKSDDLAQLTKGSMLITLCGGGIAAGGSYIKIKQEEIEYEDD